jgi:hypothetical protein
VLALEDARIVHPQHRVAQGVLEAPRLATEARAGRRVVHGHHAGERDGGLVRELRRAARDALGELAQASEGAQQRARDAAWRTTGDRLFAIFAAAFGVLGIQRLALAFSRDMAEDQTALYLVRLFAFLLILAAIVDKNRSNPQSSA